MEGQLHKNPFWVITRGSLLRSLTRTDFQGWLSYPQRNKPQKWYQNPKIFVPFMVRTQHNHAGVKSWDWPHENPPPEEFETFPLKSSAVPTPGIPSKTPKTSQPAQFHYPNPWMGKTAFLMIYYLHRIPNTSKVPLKPQLGHPFLQDKPESFIELKKGEGWFNPRHYNAVDSPFTSWRPKFPMHSQASAAENELKVEDFQGAWAVLEK